jgi:Tol biopolymer transport system component
MTGSGTNHRSLSDYGNYPNWHPSEGKILYLTRAVTNQGQAIGDSLWTYDVTTNNRSFLTFLGGLNNDNRHPRYSPDGTKIAFWSKQGDGIGNIWVMSVNGSFPQQVTTEGAGDWLSWGPDGKKIAYVSHRFTDWTYANGTNWIIDVETGEKRQLTFNHPPQ